MQWKKFIPLLSVLLWAALWSAGGFLILVNTIKTQRHETTLLGLGLGLVLQVWLANLTGRSGALRLLAQCGARIHRWTLALTIILKSWKSAQHLVFPPGQCLAFFALLYAFFHDWARGPSLMTQNLPVTSMLARGASANFPLNPALRFDYHYLLLLNAPRTRLAGFFPWTPWTSPGRCASVCLLYTFLLGLSGSPAASGAWLSAVFAAFAGGTRWILFRPAGCFQSFFQNALP